jgi:hypothetical protein
MHAIARNTIRADCPKPLGYPIPTPQTSRRDSALPSLLLKEKLRGKLARLVNPQPEVEDARVIEGSMVSTDQEFGFDDDD